MNTDPELEKLGRQLDQIHAVEAAESRKQAQNAKDAENMGNGMKAGIELVGAVLAGGALGWALDNWLGTKPVMLIIMLLLGIFTGFYNVWRTTQNIGSSVGFSELHRPKKDAKTSADKNNG